MTVEIQNGVSHKSALPLVQKLSNDHDLVLKTFRLLIADLCQQFNGGHPGYDSRNGPLSFAKLMRL
jgi:dihydroxyacetone synthase